VTRIWDQAPHNAFTDLLRWRGQWVCAFREGTAHASDDGTLRVLTSLDGEIWISAARIEMPGADLRDASLCELPDGRIMLSTAAATRALPLRVRHQTYAWYTDDPARWSRPLPIGEPNVWLWRVRWSGKSAFGAGYDANLGRWARMYRSEDGMRFVPIAPRLFDRGDPSEATLVFRPDGTAHCLLRRDSWFGLGTLGRLDTGLLGTAEPPYEDWTWFDLGVPVGGPVMLLLPDGRIVGAVRLYEPQERTVLVWLDPARGRMQEWLTLPSGGDTSYAGLVWHEDVLWVSYYSSHEGKSAIYLARVRLPPASPALPQQP
jgi:hypothetical protein